MSKPKLRVYHSYEQQLTSDDQLTLGEMQARHAKRELAEMARDLLAWSTNLVSDKRYRLCPDGCGLVFMSRHNKGEHLDPAQMDADWLEDAPQGQESFMQAPIEPPPLKPAVSVAQVEWSHRIVAQYPRKSKEQICRENGGISWEQLERYAQTPTKGLPERKGQKAPAPKDQAKPVEKPTKPKKATKKAGGAR